MTATKAGDPRPESYRVDEASIRLVERSKLTQQAKVRLWQPFIATSLNHLYTENRGTNRSLGIIHPDSGSLKFIVKRTKDIATEDQEVAEQVLQAHQNSLLEAPLRPLEKPEFAFSYRYKSGGNPHHHVIHDWEVQEAYRKYKRRYRDGALDHLKKMYGKTIPADNLHFIMGTMASHLRTFIVIGLLRSAFDPEELGKQGSLL